MTSPTDPQVPIEQVPSADRREEVQALYDAVYGRGFRLSDTFWRFIESLDAQSAERTNTRVMEAIWAGEARVRATAEQTRAEVEKMKEALIDIVGDTACPECGWAGTIITRMRALPIESPSR